MLACFGISVGFATKYLGNWGDGAEEISSIDPHLFFLIFLPPLIFESAFSIDWHIIKAEIVQILILAGPGLVINAFVTAAVMRFVLMYDGAFTFEAAVMFGALISATDPVAVVSLLKDLGASRTLSTLIEGESLINDGTAFVLFTITLDLVKGESLDILEATGLFF
jgi:NhaP-type Na+/H+ or K+/H+ antiporter